MGKSLADISSEAIQLSEEDRLQLTRLLLDSFDLPETPFFSSEAWEEEIRLRHEELMSGKIRGIPLEDLKKEIEKTLKK